MRVAATTVELELKQSTWPDNRIVAGVQCVGLDGSYNAQAVLMSSRFACYTQSWRKPASTSASLWGRLGAAMRAGNVALLYRLLGVPANSTPAQVNAAGTRILGRARPAAVGVDAIDATHVRLRSSPIATRSFVRSVNARHALLAVVPGVEAYYTDHQTYVGVTAAKLAAPPYDTRVPSYVRIVSTTARGYCVQAAAAGTTWSVRRPGGTPLLAACR